MSHSIVLQDQLSGYQYENMIVKDWQANAFLCILINVNINYSNFIKIKISMVRGETLPRHLPFLRHRCSRIASIFCRHSFYTTSTCEDIFHLDAWLGDILRSPTHNPSSSHTKRLRWPDLSRHPQSYLSIPTRTSLTLASLQTRLCRKICVRWWSSFPEQNSNDWEWKDRAECHHLSTYVVR